MFQYYVLPCEFDESVNVGDINGINKSLIVGAQSDNLVFYVHSLVTDKFGITKNCLNQIEIEYKEYEEGSPSDIHKDAIALFNQKMKRKTLGNEYNNDTAKQDLDDIRGYFSNSILKLYPSKKAQGSIFAIEVSDQSRNAAQEVQLLKLSKLISFGDSTYISSLYDTVTDEFISYNSTHNTPFFIRSTFKNRQEEDDTSPDNTDGGNTNGGNTNGGGIDEID